MPHNVAYGQNGFNSPPMINTCGPQSPGMSSGGMPSPGSLHSPTSSGLQVPNGPFINVNLVNFTFSKVPVTRDKVLKV